MLAHALRVNFLWSPLLPRPPSSLSLSPSFKLLSCADNALADFGTAVGEDKANQLMGATLMSSGEIFVVSLCGPYPIDVHGTCFSPSLCLSRTSHSSLSPPLFSSLYFFPSSPPPLLLPPLPSLPFPGLCSSLCERISGDGGRRQTPTRNVCLGAKKPHHLVTTPAMQ